MRQVKPKIWIFSFLTVWTLELCMLCNLSTNSDIQKAKGPMVNFGEVQRAQLAKSTLLTSSFVPLGSFQIF